VPDENRKKHLCPNCGKELEISWMFDNSFFDYSWRRADLPFFLCGDCRVAFIDKKLLLLSVSTWRNGEKALSKRISFRDAHQKAKESLDETLKYYVENVGYKIIPYKKCNPAKK